MLDIIQRKPLNYCMYLCIVSSFSRSAPINQAICLSQKTYSQLIETNKSKIKSPKKKKIYRDTGIGLQPSEQLAAF